MDPRLEQLSPETIDRLAKKAQAEGLSLNAYLNVLLGFLNEGTTLAEVSDAEFGAFIEDFSRGSEHFPPLPPDFSRTDIYTDHNQISYLFDTNIFLRLTNKTDPAHTLAVEALSTLRTRREMLCSTPQVLAEFWSVCTRPPSARGGFGLLPSEAERRARVIEHYFRLLPDSVTTYQEWRQLLVRHAVAGVQVHDARLSASMKVYGITHLLTFNGEDFTRYPDITVVAPQHVPQTQAWLRSIEKTGQFEWQKLAFYRVSAARRGSLRSAQHTCPSVA